MSAPREIDSAFLARIHVKRQSLARPLAVFLATISLILTGILGSPAVAADDKGLGVPPASAPSNGPGSATALSGDAYVFREHAIASHERVDLREARIAKVWDQHRVSFTALVRVIGFARSPRWKTSPDGIDRGVYKYRIYEYEADSGGTLRKTGKWVVVQFVIEWGDGVANRGWLVTAYPVATQSGAPPKDVYGDSYCPAWLANTAVMGPVNNDILY
jgi:hypothetical protein